MEHVSFERKEELIEGDIQEQDQFEMMEDNYHLLEVDNCCLDVEDYFQGNNFQEEEDKH